MGKDDLRKLLEAATKEFTAGKEITRYAAYPAPEKKHPQRKIPNLKKEAYDEFISGLSTGR